jgi:hypothetical protein
LVVGRSPAWMTLTTFEHPEKAIYVFGAEVPAFRK